MGGEQVQFSLVAQQQSFTLKLKLTPHYPITR